MKQILLSVFMVLITIFNVQAQINPQAEALAREELKKRGLNEDEVRERLESRGIDIYAINPNNAQEMLAAQAALDEVLQELESEKAGLPKNPNSTSIDTLKEKDKKVIAKNSEEVSDAIGEGATLEEAVSETLTDDQTRELPKSRIYGQEVFRSQSIKFYRQSKDVKAPDNYVLGVGDVIAISIWGASEESTIYEINSDGYIKPNGIPRIYLKGIAYKEARELLRKRYSNYYSFGPNQFEISLNFSRTINVSVVGEVYNHGSFNIPAINTAFNALVAAGGPNDIGSVRKIQLMRAGDQPRTIDIYKYLSNPSIEGDFYLQENDIINVPPAEKLVKISGAVRKPFTYELLKNENLKALVKYARGLKANALKKNIQVIRYENDEEIMIDLNWAELEASSRDFQLRPGDRVNIKSIQSNFNNVVTVTGTVELPGEYAFVKGERLSDLVQKIDFKESALLSISYLQRLNDDRRTISYIKVNLEEAIKNPRSIADIELKQNDKISILSKSLFVDQSTITTIGAIRNERTIPYDYDKSLRVSDAIFLSGGLKTDATGFGYIKREDPDNPKQIQYIKIDFDEIMNNPNSASNLLLEARDVIEIQSKNQFVDEQFISVEGYVRIPRQLKYDETLTIQDAINLSGGLKYEAASNRVDIYRVDINDENQSKIVAGSFELDENFNAKGEIIQLQPYDQIVVRRSPEFSLQQKVIIRGNVKYPGPYAILDKNERLSSLIKRAGGLTEEADIETMTIQRTDVGYVISDFANAYNKPGSIDDLIIKSGDVIEIPELEGLVTIKGFTTANELYKKSSLPQKALSVPYEKGKNAKYYIDKYAGGVSDSGSKKDVIVANKSGKIEKTKRFLFFKNYPTVNRGSTITVGPKPVEIEKKNRDSDVDWGRVFQNSITQATSILTLLLLVQRVD